MRIVVIDGQGGSIGRQLIKTIKEACPFDIIHAVGTNSIATGNMLKESPTNAATGEIAVIVSCRNADVIVGPIGIVIADALMGEVTPAMAKAVGQSQALRILIPMSRCDTLVAGIGEEKTSDLLNDAVAKIKALSSAKAVQI